MNSLSFKMALIDLKYKLKMLKLEIKHFKNCDRCKFRNEDDHHCAVYHTVIRKNDYFKYCTKWKFDWSLLKWSKLKNS